MFQSGVVGFKEIFIFSTIFMTGYVKIRNWNGTI
jgi:hypothetical protein